MAAQVTLHATRCGQNFPKPRGGWILLSRVTTSKCLILPLQEDTQLGDLAAPPREWANGKRARTWGTNASLFPNCV